MAQGTIRPLERPPLLHRWASDSSAWMRCPSIVIVFATQFANLALVAWIGARLTGRRSAGFLAAALWATSDTAVLPLGWASAYNQVLCGFFLLLAFHFLLRYVETGDPRYNLYQWIAFLLGFGAMELNIVYPALAGAYTLVVRAPLSEKGVAAVPAFGGVFRDSPGSRARRQGPQLHPALHRARCCARWRNIGPGRWVRGLLGAGRAAQLADPRGGSAGLAGLAGFRGMRGRTAAFCLAWFVIAIAPVLPLRDHVTEYYSFLPAIGTVLAGRLGAGGEPGVRAQHANRRRCPGRRLPVDHAAANGGRIGFQLPAHAARPNLVEGVARAHRLHPGQTILLDGVDTALFYHGVLDHPFRLLGIDHLYLTPASARGRSTRIPNWAT
jgi:hypothetical protein